MNTEMRDRFRVVVLLMLVRFVDGRREVLLQERKNTPIMGGEYFFVAGHLKRGEVLEHALIREAKEEIGIDIKVPDLRLRGVVQIMEFDATCLLYTVERYYGEPRICEPELASDLRWVDCEDLPANTNIYVRKAIEAWMNDTTDGQIISIS